jgi:hypothetical protein
VEPSNEQPSNTAAGKYEHLQGYTFLVPNEWEVVTLEHLLKDQDKREVMPLLSLPILYLVYPDQKHPKASFTFQVTYDSKNIPWHRQSEQFKVDKIRDLERELGAEMKLVENKSTTMNGVEVTSFHYTFSSLLRSGDVIVGFFRKGESTLWVEGEFSQPVYSELHADISAVLESIRKE